MRNGTSALMSDTMKYVALIANKDNDFDPQKLTLDNVELYYEVGNQLKHNLPILTVIALPFGNLIAAPLALKYPKQLLSPHFWTENQKETFALMDHERRVLLYDPLISQLYDPLALDLCPEWGKLLDDVKNGKTPLFSDLWSSRRLFDAYNPPLYLENLNSKMKNILIEMNCIPHRIPMNEIDKLKNHYTYLKCVDDIIDRNIIGRTMLHERLRKYCFQRGVNAHEMTDGEMRSYLTQWLNVSARMNLENCTYLLVLPALLARNHPSNRSILEKSKSI